MTADVRFLGLLRQYGAHRLVRHHFLSKYLITFIAWKYSNSVMLCVCCSHKQTSCIHWALTTPRWRVKLELELKREPELRGDVAEKPSVDGPGGASVSSGPPPHIQSLTLFIQHIPLTSNQEKYSLFVRFGRQSGGSSPQPRRDQRSARLKLWVSPDFRSGFNDPLWALCVHTKRKTNTDSDPGPEPDACLLILDSVCVQIREKVKGHLIWESIERFWIKTYLKPP